MEEPDSILELLLDGAGLAYSQRADELAPSPDLGDHAVVGARQGQLMQLHALRSSFGAIENSAEELSHPVVQLLHLN